MAETLRDTLTSRLKDTHAAKVALQGLAKVA
jgi:hypothetical protein